MLTCIYEAFNSGMGHKNIKLMLEPIREYTLFDEYVHVNGDVDKAEKVRKSVISKISPHVYHEMCITAMAYEEDVLDNIYHVLILGFSLGENVLNMMQYRDIMRNHEIRLRVGREANRFREVIRFHQVGDVYIAHIEPKSRVAEYLGPVFADRMPSCNFIIVDYVHRDAVIHPADEAFYMMKLTEDELTSILETEKANDEYTDLWKVFFETIAIKERTNSRCQNNLFPMWTRTHAVEFN